MMDLSKEMKEKLSEAKSDVDACKMLADNGIDVEEFEKSLSESELETIKGGYTPAFSDFEIECPNCHNGEKEMISRQFWASMFCDSATKYRCRNCNTCFKVYNNGSIQKYD